MDYKKLIIRGISYSQTQMGAYALILEQEETGIKLPVVIGNYEAQSISLGLEKDIQPPRPLTHDLFSKFITTVGYYLDSIIIYQIIDGVFFSNLILKNNQDEQLVLDARTSDAVAMAVRFDAPIYTTEQVLTEAGIMLELSDNERTEERIEEESPVIKGYEVYTLEELQELLEKAVNDEDFDTALELQQEIKKRKKNID
ncbi:bifunctional nuclease family protein [Elizabethkingia meningoseptica]|uniref:bifunctional nuclease family protein n=1 Tax=Elizabethkingia meningoseptica TaxID=238 RepID=UPI0023B1FC58|nr:bifunctional nuclease family protein [Elizabethkingia meningoseptica]MDE5436428.1 bifunctional nuclease family protein [Elizabethkingia meningoseptica]MDE5508372.1 bifunctional nuclease family protein [Elizabethkingia meningoseptica]MDE5515062.1 bifunctional nuclease family protein [Elizabethkingia meningoseptica]MDE5525798.1 bifunctional nuclease family protein [Elizabethkingia meningoseptica]MDE5529328.1 bifunctional nuclease family protein [Elizabethkingia meningoseptica]